MLTIQRNSSLTALGLILAGVLGCVPKDQPDETKQPPSALEEQSTAMREQLADSAKRIGEEARKVGDQAGKMGRAVGEEAAELGDRTRRMAEQAALGPPTLVINLTAGKDDVHRAAMGLHLAEHGLAAERQVVVFFNVKSPELAVKDLPDSVGLEDKPSIAEMVAKLAEDGAVLLVCPMCADVMGVSADQLAPGVSMVADRMQLFDRLGANTVVFTY
jgi:predicted peroxiredoxin